MLPHHCLIHLSLFSLYPCDTLRPSFLFVAIPKEGCDLTVSKDSPILFVLVKDFRFQGGGKVATSQRIQNNTL